MKPDDKHYLRELTRSATTEDDLQAATALFRELQDQSQPIAKPAYTVRTLGEVAAFFGVQLQTVKEWRVGPDKMPGDPGAYDLSQIARWKIDKASRSNGNNTLSEVQRKRQEADARGKTAQAEKRELEMRQLRGQMLDRRDVETWVASALVEARETLMRLPDAVAGSSPVEVRDFARAETDRQVRGVLEMLRRKLDDLPEMEPNE